MSHDVPAPDITVDGTGLLCVTLLLRLRQEMTAGAVLRVEELNPAT